MQLTDLSDYEYELSGTYVADNNDWTDYLYMRPLGSLVENENDYFNSKAPCEQRYGLMCNIFHNQNRIGYGFHITATQSFQEDIICPRILNMLNQYIPNCPVLEIRFFDECDF